MFCFDIAGIHANQHKYLILKLLVADILRVHLKQLKYILSMKLKQRSENQRTVQKRKGVYASYLPKTIYCA